MGTYTECRGNIFGRRRSGYTIIPHVCNNRGAWGAGFTAALDGTFPWVGSTYKMFMLRYKAHGRLMGKNVSAVVDNYTIVIGMIAQNGLPSSDNPEPLSYPALRECMENVRTSATAHGIYTIHCPKFGCGIARGDWNVIERMIREIWVDSGLDVTVWSL